MLLMHFDGPLSRKLKDGLGPGAPVRGMLKQPSTRYFLLVVLCPRFDRCRRLRISSTMPAKFKFRR
jgi:hypothetical protein